MGFSRDIADDSCRKRQNDRLLVCVTAHLTSQKFCLSYATVTSRCTPCVSHAVYVTSCTSRHTRHARTSRHTTHIIKHVTSRQVPHVTSPTSRHTHHVTHVTPYTLSACYTSRHTRHVILIALHTSRHTRHVKHITSYTSVTHAHVHIRDWSQLNTVRLRSVNLVQIASHFRWDSTEKFINTTL